MPGLRRTPFRIAPARGCLAAGLAAAWLGALGGSSLPAAAVEEFPDWLSQLASEAKQRGISPATVATALEGVEPLPDVLELDRSQPRAPGDFCHYMERRLTPTRIERGRRVIAEHRDLLEEIARQYGVPARYLVAMWGLETNFGDYVGDFPVVGALVTLAHDPRRSGLFREEIFAALRILDEGHRDAAGFVGSWAGATRQVQLMPSTFLEYAVDHDGDGRKDVWSSLPDALATAANVLKRAGWHSGESWGRQVSVPPELVGERATLRRTRPLADWQRAGVRRIDGSDLPVADLRGRIVLPLRGPGPSFLVYRNYGTFLAWNRSTFFAVSLGTLADEISGAGSLEACGLGSRRALAIAPGRG
jgi:membrane-bound lytic murein transglycosylase B